MATPLKEIYQKILSMPADDHLWREHIWEGPTASDLSSWMAEGYDVYQGKIRTVLSRDGRVQMIHSDRLTAFDRLIDNVPLKGVILSAISKFWLEQASNVVPTHFIDANGPRTLLTECLQPIKAEVVVRGYLAGSIQRAYASGERLFCGVRLPDGLVPFGRLPEPIITPTTKAAAFEHDENTTADELIRRGVCTQREWDTLSSMAFKVFDLGTRIYGEKGWLLVDTKYEFGRTQDGTIKLIDEVHTPDSSRLWKMLTYESRLRQNMAPEMLDKENVRRWLIEQGFSGFGDVPVVPRAILIELAQIYLLVAETLLGRPLSV
jgi:phosphoribosylaminoimidazole-succinocarboxamide synthase